MQSDAQGHGKGKEREGEGAKRRRYREGSGTSYMREEERCLKLDAWCLMLREGNAEISLLLYA